MKVLILKNAKNEGSGNLSEFLHKRKIHFREIEAYEENWTHVSLKAYDYLIILGGPMGVYEMDKYPFLRTIAEGMKIALNEGIKILGICLGAQLLAHVLGAEVFNSGKEENGWCGIRITNDGLRDECISSFSENQIYLEVFQWHGDTFNLPKGAKRLAYSDDFENQAFSFNGSYGLQFHPEVTPHMIREWFEGREDFDEMWQKTESLYPIYRYRAEKFYERFFSLK
jgi:GMP synthase-like glutamine amidotransferase